MEIRLRDLRTGYVQLVHQIREEGNQLAPRGLATRELTGVTLRVANTRQPMLPVGVGRMVNTRQAAVEALQLIGGVDAHELLLRAVPNYGDVLVDQVDPAYGAYGPRLAPQLPEVIQLLLRDPDTRQAVLQIWERRDLAHVGDKPCTLSLQFLLRFGELELHVNMRSQDVWRGVPYDVFMFTQLQLTVARMLDVRPGAYVHHVASLHLYETDVEASHRLAQPGDDRTDLPLGVVPVQARETAVSLTLANVRELLRNGRIDPTWWRDANRWYVDRVEQLHARREVAP